MQEKFPTSAQVVIIGGGIMGCGLAFHLAQLGCADVLLLEKAELTSGSTWHAAGQITHSTSSFSLGKCVDYNIKLYSGELEKLTDQQVTWHGCGSLRLAYTPDEMDWLRHTLSVGRALKFNMELVSPSRIAELHPFYNLDGVLGALHTPDDGHVDPTNVTMAFAAGARSHGVKIIRKCRATNITLLANGEWRVETELGSITCQHVVNAAGTYARQIGEWNDLLIPATSMTHHYFVTDNVPEFENLQNELPVIRDDKKVSGYIRMEQQRGLIGIYEKENPNSIWHDHCPWESENELFAPDYDRVMPYLENAMQRMPIFAELGIAREIHGAISHPPDGNPLIGPVGGAKNYWCCCGTQIGIGWGPGLTLELAKWILHGSADISMREYDPRRFDSHATKDWQIVKAHEDYCLRHEIPFPHFNRLAGRPVCPSPLYEVLKTQGAVYEEIYGFERPRWFATNGVQQCDHYSFKRNVVQECIAREIKSVRENCGLMDITAFTKVRVQGAGATAFLDRLSANKLPQKPGGVVLSYLLNKFGRIEIELTIFRMEENVYYLVCAAFFEKRLLDHLYQNVGNEQIKIEALSKQWSALCLNGPRARDVLSQCTTSKLDNENFAWLTGRKINIGTHEVWAMRISYAGELGWELHMENDACLDVYNSLVAVGEKFSIANYGSFAMNVMRMEKSFKGASELTNEVTLPEANVLRFVDTKKEFLGKQKTFANKNNMPWICVYLQIEADGIDDGNGGEAVLLHGKTIGSVSSIVYSPTVEKILAFAYVDVAASSPNTELEVLIAGKPRVAKVLDLPAYDSKNILPRTDA